MEKQEGKETDLVDLVPDHDLHDCRRDVRLELGEPPRERIEGFPVCDVVHENDALRAAVVGRRYCAKTLLARRVLRIAQSFQCQYSNGRRWK